MRVDEIIRRAVLWDVMGGVARRAWARNEGALATGIRYNEGRRGSDHLTLPYLADGEALAALVDKAFTEGLP